MDGVYEATSLADAVVAKKQSFNFSQAYDNWNVHEIDHFSTVNIITMLPTSNDPCFTSGFTTS